jgi:hypothetical protein
MISPEDAELLYVTDDPVEAVEIVVRSNRERYAGLPDEPRKADAQ